MPHANKRERTEYLRVYNQSDAGKARTLKYRQTERGMLYYKLKQLRRKCVKNGEVIPEELYLKHPMYNDPMSEHYVPAARSVASYNQ